MTKIVNFVFLAGMIVLTGGAGFIGSVMLAKLNEQGLDNVLVVDDLGQAEKWQNLVGKRFEDCIDKSEFRSWLGDANSKLKPTCVIHMGACTSTTETDARYLLDNNYRYSRELHSWAEQHSARFIYASSAAIYGDGNLGFSDDHQQTASFQPLNMYAYSKQLFDDWAIRTGAINKCVGLRFFNVFGPNEYHKGDMRSVVHKAFEQIRDTGSVKLFKSYRDDYADGEQVRDFVYVKDCVNVMWQLFERPEINGIYNLGTGKARSWKDLITAVFQALGKAPSIEFMEMPEQLRNKYQYFTEADLGKLRKDLAQAEFRSLEDSVQDYVSNYLSPKDPNARRTL